MAAAVSSPPADGHTVVVALDTGTAQPGVWCERCALPSAVAVPVYAMSGAGVALVLTVEACAGCGARTLRRH